MSGETDVRLRCHTEARETLRLKEIAQDRKRVWFLVNHRPGLRTLISCARGVFRLPLTAIASGDPPTALPQRNLLRQVTWLLPSGQSIAREIGVDALAPGDLEELKGYRLGLERSTPLWYYVLKEAEVMADGTQLGPVGGRIVTEVIIGLLQTDPESFLFRSRNWRPELPTRSGGTGDFRMVDFLTFAGVDPTSRGE